jgi:hypothetical protein
LVFLPMFLTVLTRTEGTANLQAPHVVVVALAWGCSGTDRARRHGRDTRVVRTLGTHVGRKTHRGASGRPDLAGCTPRRGRSQVARCLTRGAARMSRLSLRLGRRVTLAAWGRSITPPLTRDVGLRLSGEARVSPRESA